MEAPHRRVAAAFCGNQAWQLDRVFASGRRAELERGADVFPYYISSANFPALSPSLDKVEALFSTWGMDEDLALLVRELPRLKVLFHAAGSVQAFARPLHERGVVVVSAWAANAVPVARFTLAQILLSFKGYFRNVRDYGQTSSPDRLPDLSAPGISSETVGLLGCGMVGRTVAELLRPFGLDVAVCDPFLTDRAAAASAVRKVSLAELFSSALVISNHLPDLPSTRGLLDRGLFAAMRPGATFINTGRGATVDEEGLADILASRPDLTALLDVTFPEPPAPGSRLRSLPNAHLSSHIAGSNGNEVVLMADLCLEEFRAWREGRPLRYQVTAEMLDRLA